MRTLCVPGSSSCPLRNCIKTSRIPLITACGTNALAEELSCSASTLYAIKQTGALQEAIISHIGRTIVYDVNKARYLANEYQQQKRNK